MGRIDLLLRLFAVALPQIRSANDLGSVGKAPRTAAKIEGSEDEAGRLVIVR